MTLIASDLVLYYTNTGTTVNPENSTGSTINNNTIPDGTISSQGVFNDVGDESEVGTTIYRCIALKNTHSTDSYFNCKMWISGFVKSSGVSDTFYFALETGNPNSVQLIASETVAPDTAQFTVPYNSGTTYGWTIEATPSGTQNYGTLPAGSWSGIWLKRVVPVNTDSFNDRSCTLQWEGEVVGSPRMILRKSWIINLFSEKISLDKYSIIGET